MSVTGRRLFAVLLAAAAGACSDDLAGGATCPSLCPEQTLPIEEVVLDAVAFDTTLAPFPVPGTEIGVLLASRGDSLDVRGIFRYDSLPRVYPDNGVDRQIVDLDSARIRVRFDTTQVGFDGTITLEAYDVDTSAADTDTGALLPLFRPDRLLGSLEISRQLLFLDDTVNVPISNAVLLQKIAASQRLRVGFRMVGTGELIIQSVESALAPVLVFDPAPDNPDINIRAVSVNSRTPAGDPFGASDRRDFSLPVIVPPAPTERLSAGGLPAQRSFLRLNIPPYYRDSVVLVRAQLRLVQRPVSGVADGDSALVYLVAASSSSSVTDLARVAQLAYPPLSFGIAPVYAAPRDSGERRIDIIMLLRQWTLDVALPDPPQTAILLRRGDEGRAVGRLAFYGLDAPADLRPRLHLSFVRRSRFGLP
jgi:hypothetical protein